MLINININSFMLHPLSYKNNRCALCIYVMQLVWCTDVFLWCIFYFMECLVGSNVTHHKKDNCILYYSMNVYKSAIMGLFLTISKHLIIWLSKGGSDLHPTSKGLVWPHIHCFFKVFPKMVRYNHYSNTIAPLHRIVAA